MARVGRHAGDRLRRDPSGVGSKPRRLHGHLRWRHGDSVRNGPRASESRAALISGYLNTFRDSIGSLAHCIDNYVPGILNWAEMHDVAGLIAPRPLFVESGEKDNIFPIGASVESFNEVRKIYDVFGASDRIEHEVFPGEHSFWGKRGIPFLARHMGA